MAKDSKVFAKNEVVKWSGEGREGNYRIASVNKTKKTANMRGLGSTRAKVPFKAIPWSELTHTDDRPQMSYERYRSMEDGGKMARGGIVKRKIGGMSTKLERFRDDAAKDYNNYKYYYKTSDGKWDDLTNLVWKKKVFNAYMSQEGYAKGGKVGDEVIVVTNMIGSEEIKGKIESLSPFKIRTDDNSVTVVPNRAIIEVKSTYAKGGKTKGQTLSENFNLNDNVKNIEFWNNDVIVENKGKASRIDLDKGERIDLNARGGKMASGGMTRAKLQSLSDSQLRDLRDENESEEHHLLEAIDNEDDRNTKTHYQRQHSQNKILYYKIVREFKRRGLSMYAKGGKMASGGLFDSEGRKYSKKRGEFLTSEWFSGDLDFLNY
jgi:hypothetical protein